MKVYSQLIAAQFENLSSDPSVGTVGRIWFNTTSGLPKSDNGAAIRQFIMDNDTQTMSKKTFGDELTLTEISTPSNPSAGLVKLYPKNDDNIYFLNSAGTELKLVTSATTGLTKSNLVKKTANYTATTTDDVVLCDASGGIFTITLPTAVSATGKVYRIKKTDSTANAVTVATTSSQTIDGASNYIIDSTGESLDFISDGSNWYVL